MNLDSFNPSEKLNPAVFGRFLLAVLIPLIVLLCAIFLACILSYLAVLIWQDASLRTLLKKLTQILLFLSIFPAMSYLKLNKSELGFAPRPIFLKQLAIGFVLGFVTLIPVFCTFYWLGVDVIDTSKPWNAVWLAKKLGLGLLLALLISLFEEPVFRGILLSGMKKKIGIEPAILFSAIYYAILHFLNTPTEIPGHDVTIASGFQLTSEAFQHLLNPQIFTAFLALCAVGIFLGMVRTSLPESLGLCIGCHACWVWQIKLSKDLFNINPHSDYLFLVSGYDGVIGPLVTFWLVCVVLGYMTLKKFNTKNSTA